MNYKVGEPLLTLDGVSLNYGDKKILRDINIKVNEIVGETTTGQVITLVGKSGIGKTQLFKIIAGLTPPSVGSVLIGQKQVPVIPGVVGMVLQTYPLFQHRTLIDNLLLVSKDRGKIDSYLEEFDIYQHRDKYPKQLSGEIGRAHV